MFQNMSDELIVDKSVTSVFAHPAAAGLHQTKQVRLRNSVEGTR